MSAAGSYTSTEEPGTSRRPPAVRAVAGGWLLNSFHNSIFRMVFINVVKTQEDRRLFLTMDKFPINYRPGFWSLLS